MSSRRIRLGTFRFFKSLMNRGLFITALLLGFVGEFTFRLGSTMPHLRMTVATGTAAGSGSYGGGGGDGDTGSGPGSSATSTGSTGPAGSTSTGASGASAGAHSTAGDSGYSGNSSVGAAGASAGAHSTTGDSGYSGNTSVGASGASAGAHSTTGDSGYSGNTGATAGSAGAHSTTGDSGYSGSAPASDSYSGGTTENGYESGVDKAADAAGVAASDAADPDNPASVDAEKAYYKGVYSYYAHLGLDPNEQALTVGPVQGLIRAFAAISNVTPTEVAVSVGNEVDEAYRNDPTIDVSVPDINASTASWDALGINQLSEFGLLNSLLVTGPQENLAAVFGSRLRPGIAGFTATGDLGAVAPGGMVAAVNDGEYATTLEHEGFHAAVNTTISMAISHQVDSMSPAVDGALAMSGDLSFSTTVGEDMSRTVTDAISTDSYYSNVNEISAYTVSKDLTSYSANVASKYGITAAEATKAAQSVVSSPAVADAIGAMNDLAASRMGASLRTGK